jgi:hypothetical protein
MSDKKFPSVEFYQMPIGMDVEMFIETEGEVRGAEKYIKESSIKVSDYHHGSHIFDSKIAKDGVQIELNPTQNRCREVLGQTVRDSMIALEKWRQKNKIDISFKQNIELSKEEFESLSDDSKKFGCSPDYNAYNACKVNIKPSGKETKVRCAGGHIHFGYEQPIFIHTNEIDKKCKDCELPCKCFGEKRDVTDYFKSHKISIHEIENEKCNVDLMKNIFKFLSLTDEPERYVFSYDQKIDVLKNPAVTIPLIDVFCGIPSVLVDRDTGSKERRKQYGRAGDFRYQPHGIEYRTLSNFWIQNYTLMHLFTGLARMGIIVANYDLQNDNYFTNLIFKKVKREDVAKAINENDFNLAKDIFLKLEDVFVKIGEQFSNNSPLSSRTIGGFKMFVIKGYKKWFKQPAIQTWIEENMVGWERFASELEIPDNIHEQFKNYKKD